MIPVTEYFYGKASDLYPDLNPNEHWNENFMQRLANDKAFHMEEDSPTCDNKVPHEGIVIKIENMKSEAFKLKCFKFLDKEGKLLDKGEVNIEDVGDTYFITSFTGKGDINTMVAASDLTETAIKSYKKKYPTYTINKN